MLIKNLIALRREKDYSQEDVAKAIEVGRSTYAGYEKGKSEPTASVLLKLADFYQIKIDDLFRELALPPLFRTVKSPARLVEEDIRVLVVTVDSKQQENIQYVPIAAQAGYVSDHGQSEYIQQLPHFHLPKLGNNATYRAFDIKGDSMPPIRDGYILVGSYVQSDKEIKDGERYVLIIKSGGIVFKKVVRDSTRTPRLILISDNPEFLPYSVDLAEVLEAWKMVAFIGCPTVYEDMTHVVNERLQIIEEKINNIRTTKS